MIELTDNERWALGAIAIMAASIDDNLRDLTADERGIALLARRKAAELLGSTGIQPTELKNLGLDLIRGKRSR